MRIVFIGTGDIGVPTLQALLKSEHEVVGVVTQSDKPVGRAQLVEPPPIKKALMSGAPDTSPARTGRVLPMAVLQPERIKHRQAIEEIRALKPDVIVVMAYGQILPGDVLEIPKIASLNLHASLLPRWRGAAPIQAAIAAGDRETGITVMYIDEGLDTGDILLQRTIDILPADTGGSLHERLAKIAPGALLESLELLAKESASRIPQDNALATYAPKLKREDGKIDWTDPADAIERKIRAFDPWPGAFMTISMNGGHNLKIFSATVVGLPGTPGEILKCENELVVATGKDALSLREVQLEGKRRMSAGEFLRGHRVLSS
ncbi:MAG: methionyl-tRNA formyltransferase [Verrucomicrobia bacterium 13_2_20CM_54_12]|nr:MAG: methionyl-tRNA formyltransferase [Verrucomicrobia bacterium 13_2_20CM_54_12]